MPHPLLSWSNPAVRTLAATIATAYGAQVACAAFAVPMQTEKYYDLSGGATFIGCTVMSLYYPALHAKFVQGKSVPFPAITSFHPRQLLLSGFTILWAGRLSSFLFQRIQKHGSDSRFDDIKPYPLKFFGAWMAQATWVTLTALPCFLVNSIPARLQPGLGIRDFVGVGLWIGAFLFEAIADRQKSAWRAEKEAKKHDEPFIKSGLWSLSRHPNYFGEVSMWASQYIVATTALAGPGAATVFPTYFVALAAISPIFEYCLIRYASGVPMLEKAQDKKMGDDPAWKKYKAETPVFVPKLP
ncbi:uncharacterized protein L969DRAFT_85091 [Mixia osmundae IAM 14324]|uniref:Uncharacterized protein n=1 Tax=Mixia osmundae (strain CBS 9802 / IAM 14324 / JCM 22182 / KY 12970) TaxID=764103 RepID=G7DXV0_MIXOS|nr:uncharacterized protein L969DRAFT_85091 [Mixia osmundae IAM 14324]KEI41313.1 hypothetical protein L969DRAFT_85091 [Mixia osmundae IAM 14324]GAA95410.1 hypothetical protein E5Q_02064 [Mixia osmundae IAM 14324]